MNNKQLIEYKKTLSLSTEQREVIIGTLLGDASIPKQKSNTSYNIKFEQNINNSEYINNIYNIFRDWVGTEPKIRIIKVATNMPNRQSIWFRTYRHNKLNFYYKLFYLNGSKKIPKIINKLLTPRSLAYWFMDDGSKEKSGYYISTHSFSYTENLLLAKTLKKFKIAANVQKDRVYYRLYIKAESVNTFNNLIKPYIVNCMLYKLHLDK